MSQLAAELLRRWYGDVAPGWALRGLSALYGALTALRRLAYARGWLAQSRLPVPVIVVGNIVVGGAGKTPLTIALVEHLHAAGWRPGVVSRGYGRQARDPHRVAPDSTPAEAGDEPLLIARRSGAPVQVDAVRVRAACELVATGCDIVVADDGLQHYRLVRDIEIEVCDGERRYGNGRLIPAGPLREPLTRAARCHLRVANGGEALPGQHAMRLHLGEARALDGSRQLPLAAFAGRRVHAIAGIGHPVRFFAALVERGIEVVPHAFPDHHPYVADDLRFADRLPILMTEKDAVKCGGLDLADAWFVPVEAELPDAFFAVLDARLAPFRTPPP